MVDSSGGVKNEIVHPHPLMEVLEVYNMVSSLVNILLYYRVFGSKGAGGGGALCWSIVI
jgi:hypothetical protein